MGGWMETARANARAVDQAMKQNPYKERLRQAGEYARKNGLAPQSVQTASSAIKPTEIKIADPMSGLRSRESSQYLLSDDLKSAGEQMKSDVNAKLVTDGEFANTAVKNLRANGQIEAADNLKSQLDALERERHIAELREKQAAQSSQKIPAPKPVLPQYSNSYFASPGVKEIGENLITRYNAQAMLDYMGSREYAHKQETARKRAQAEADAIYKEMQEYIANPNVNALDDPKTLDYRNRYNAALVESTPSKTQEWETEQYLDILATGGTILLRTLEKINENKSMAEAIAKDGGDGYAVIAADLDYSYLDDIRSLKRRYGSKVDDWLKYISESTNRNVQQELVTEFAAFGKKHPGLALPISVGANLFGGAGFVDVIGQKISNTIFDNDYPIDYNTPAQTFSRAASAMRQGATEGRNGADRFLYSTTAAILDSLTTMAVGKAGQVLLAGSGSTYAMHDAVLRGATDDQAFAIGMVAGGVEVVTEKIRLDSLFGLKTPQNKMGAVLNILKQAGVEGTEEGLTTLANSVADKLIMGDKSKLTTLIRDYEAAGYSRAEAERKALQEWGKELAMDVAGGAISGAVFGFGKSVYDTNNAWNKRIDRLNGTGSVDITADYEAGLFRYYSNLLKENAPISLDEFKRILYDNGDTWQQMKKQAEIVRQYEVQGFAPTNRLLMLDHVAFSNKTGAFDASGFHGKDRKTVKALAKSGNAAAMDLDGMIGFAHSQVGEPGSIEIASYMGKEPLIGLSNKRIFETLDLGDGVPRENDTEAKILEYVASMKTDRSEAFTLTILSEKHICKSCEYVVEQFKKLFPNATVNIISGSTQYGGVNSRGEYGMNNWKYRKD